METWSWRVNDYFKVGQPVLQEYWFGGALRFYTDEVSQEMWLICMRVLEYQRYVLCTLQGKATQSLSKRQALACHADDKG